MTNRSLLVNKFCPIFYLHKDDQYNPINFVEFLYHSHINGSPAFLTLTNDDTVLNNVNARIELKGSTTFLTPLERVPIYAVYRTQGNDIWITYCVCFSGLQEVDFNYVTVKLQVSETRQTEVVSVYFARHDAAGQWVDKRKLSFFGQRVKVFVSQNNHAMYPSPGVRRRYWGIHKDVSVEENQSNSWFPTNCIMVPDTCRFCAPENKWMFFQGFIGRGNTRSLSSQRFMHHLDFNRNNGLGCCWMCCH